MQFTTILLIVAIVIGIYVGIKVAPPYVRKFQIETLAEFIAKMEADPLRRKDVTMTLKKRIADNEMPVAFEDFIIERNNEYVTVAVDYEHEVTFIPENGVIPPMIRIYSFHVEAVEAVVNR